MVTTARTEFSMALSQVAAERGIEPEVVLETIKQAILAAYRKDFPGEETEEITVELNPETGEVSLLKDNKDITPSGFGRIAAQVAKQVILQRIREAEKKAIIQDYSGKIGQIATGMIQRKDGPVFIVDFGRAEGIMPSQEQVPGETYKLNQRLRFYIKEIKEGPRGQEIIVSRSDSGLVLGLFRQEVPEIMAGAVEITKIAREAGVRTKIAVSTRQAGVDPVGSCVGQKGVRVQAVIAELGQEKIDIIPYSEDLEKFIISGLSPAKNLKIKLFEKKKIAQVSAPADQLSLAIGTGGQNVRLATKLTGYKIDITSESKLKEVKKKKMAKVLVKKIVKKKKEKKTVKPKRKTKKEKTVKSGKKE